MQRIAASLTLCPDSSDKGEPHWWTVFMNPLHVMWCFNCICCKPLFIVCHCMSQLNSNLHTCTNHYHLLPPSPRPPVPSSPPPPSPQAQCWVSTIMCSGLETSTTEWRLPENKQITPWQQKTGWCVCTKVVCIVQQHYIQAVTMTFIQI